MFIVHRKRNIMSHIILFLFGYSIANAKHPPQVNKTRLSLIHSGLFQNQDSRSKILKQVFKFQHYPISSKLKILWVIPLKIINYTRSATKFHFESKCFDKVSIGNEPDKTFRQMEEQFSNEPPWFHLSSKQVQSLNFSSAST